MKMRTQQVSSLTIWHDDDFLFIKWKWIIINEEEEEGVGLAVLGGRGGRGGSGGGRSRHTVILWKFSFLSDLSTLSFL